LYQSFLAIIVPGLVPLSRTRALPLHPIHLELRFSIMRMTSRWASRLLSATTWLGSCSILLASVPGLLLYLDRFTTSGSVARRRSSVILKSSSSSPGCPTITSVSSVSIGTRDLRRRTSSRKRSAPCPLLIRRRTRSLPLCTGMWANL
jgi:hypothetical protein